VLGVASGVVLLTLGVYGLLYLLACVGLVLWKGPRLLAGAGIVAGVGLVSTVLFARVALTCGGPLDPHVSQCSTSDLTAWIAGGATVFVFGLFASALALRRTHR
jgi:hypothetical protein